MDPTKKEEYLSDTEFNKVFAMSKDQFFELPKWKRDNLKRSKLLF